MLCDVVFVSQVLIAEVEMRDKLENEWLAKENKKVDRRQWVCKSRAQHMGVFDSMAKVARCFCVVWIPCTGLPPPPPTHTGLDHRAQVS
jgi:hypothetical protein